MTKINQEALLVLVFLVVGLFVWGLITADAQQQIVRQTDPDDMKARQRIDRELEEKIRLLDREIQVDTVLLVTGSLTQVIYLDRKYPDTGYQIFITARNYRVAMSVYYATPTTDSSFTLKKSSADVSTIQYMTIYKGD